MCFIKRSIIGLVLIFIGLSCTAENKELIELVNNNSFSFSLRNKNGSFGGTVFNNHDLWECNFGRDYLYFAFDSREIYEDKVEVSYLSCNFILNGNPSYREYGQPKKTIITISKEQIIKRIQSIEKGKNNENKDIEKNGITVLAECRGLSIAENIRVREIPEIKSDIKIVGKLKKFQKVTIIESSDKTEVIDGLESCWYKIKTEEGIIGWVFGGFVKIYMNEEDIELLKNAFAKEGSEYTNQFITPDNS